MSCSSRGFPGSISKWAALPAPWTEQKGWWRGCFQGTNVSTSLPVLKGCLVLFWDVGGKKKGSPHLNCFTAGGDDEGLPCSTSTLLVPVCSPSPKDKWEGTSLGCPSQHQLYWLLPSGFLLMLLGASIVPDSYPQMAPLSCPGSWCFHRRDGGGCWQMLGAPL